MDILRKELDEIYRLQALNPADLPTGEIEQALSLASSLIKVTDGSAVITDAASNHCYVYSGSLGRMMGISDSDSSFFEADSSDEDVIYSRIHPEDIVDKRFLEYEFFKYTNNINPLDKRHFEARCRIRMKDGRGEYRVVDNSTRLVTLSPEGKIWLILCTYCLSTDISFENGIRPCIIDTHSGYIISFSFGYRRNQILSEREKQVLLLIKAGKPSKQIADILNISINTVNRHRQNILEKLSVGNSVEAVTAATLMKLI